MSKELKISKIEEQSKHDHRPLDPDKIYSIEDDIFYPPSQGSQAITSSQITELRERTQQIENDHPISMRENVKKPLWVWFVTGGDILAAYICFCIFLYNFFASSKSVSNDFSWNPFLFLLAIIVRFSMGAGLLYGLSIENDSKTLRYCNVWLRVQFFIVAIYFTKILTGFLSGLYFLSGIDNILVTVIDMDIFLYHLISFILVGLYIHDLYEFFDWPVVAHEVNIAATEARTERQKEYRRRRNQ